MGGSDDEGAFQAFEAVLVAMMIATAILFVTATANPPVATTGTGLDVNGLATGTLALLEKETDLEAAIAAALGGDPSDLEELADQVVIKGFRYALRLDNGVDVLQLAPPATGALSTPRGAGGATLLVLPNWPIPLSDPLLGYLGDYAPGDLIDLPSAGTLTWDSGPAEARSVGPDGRPWLDIWMDGSDEDAVHPAAPYGIWSLDGDPLRVRHPGGDVAARPYYGLQLLMWDGAG